MTAGLLDVYLSSMSNQLNESMRRLAVIATIFMPLTFLAGIYGMNFEHPESPWAMPELHWYWGYPLVLAAIAPSRASISATMAVRLVVQAVELFLQA